MTAGGSTVETGRSTCPRCQQKRAVHPRAHTLSAETSGMRHSVVYGSLKGVTRAGCEPQGAVLIAVATTTWFSITTTQGRGLADSSSVQRLSIGRTSTVASLSVRAGYMIECCMQQVL